MEASDPAPDGAAAREVRQRLEEERRARASQLAVLEQAIERAPVEQVEESDRTRRENLRRSLAEIDGALRRLEILPYVRYCVRCQGRANRALR
ncbi:hypothetical protein GCM10009678_86660 [Actinomadura kijaniata]|uniref:RNA polymerase-binding transcription factor DksA n=1 Tax=Actinomadura namibiensis TaxID=182080 RepID=A0A7W3LNY9_ACTNM|nr:hypothetical protein [Actinomadura namibiensis]MBA8951623.1 RNA polymerase-binding transcription factor DksA [Actinomadura namibiensis]